jgi:D-arabinose 5-phosphate isomerase GutQ
MASIFFSHSGKDEQIAEKLKRQLEQMGSDVYMFEHDQQPGAGITDKITKAIDNHDMLFALLTKNGGLSSYVQQEIGYAKKAGKPIIPFVESGIGQEALGMVADVEYIKFDPNNPDKSISDAQTYVHNHDMRKTSIALGVGAGLVIILVVVAILYYTRSNPELS